MFALGSRSSVDVFDRNFLFLKLGESLIGFLWSTEGSGVDGFKHPGAMHGH